MIYLLDGGDDYHQHIVIVAEGDGDVDAIIKDFKAKRKKHIDDYSRHEAAALKVIGKHRKQPRNPREVTQWIEEGHAHRIRLAKLIEQRGCYPMPDLSELLHKAGFKIHDFDVKRYEDD